MCFYFYYSSLKTSRDELINLMKEAEKRKKQNTTHTNNYGRGLLANTLAQAETLLHSLERAAAGIGLHTNSDKTEYMCFNQRGDISTLKGVPLKLVDKFTYLGSSVSLSEKDIYTWLAKTWSAIDGQYFIWKSGLTNKTKRSFFLAAVLSILLYGRTT